MSSTVAYSEKMLNDKFDGTVGFSIDGGIKDATFVLPCLLFFVDIVDLHVKVTSAA